MNRYLLQYRAKIHAGYSVDSFYLNIKVNRELLSESFFLTDFVVDPSPPPPYPPLLPQQKFSKITSYVYVCVYVCVRVEKKNENT